MVQAPPKQVVNSLSVNLIRVDGGTQPRAGLKQEIIDEYTQEMLSGASFPPINVFHDGQNYWLADGFHRLAAAKQARKKTILSDIRQGTRRDAVLYSVGANATHGLRRTSADKRRAVVTLLSDSEWSVWSNSEIARRSAVDEGTIRNIKRELTSENPNIAQRGVGRFGVDEGTLREAQQNLKEQPTERFAQRGDTQYTIDTSKIGKSSNTSEAKGEAPAKEDLSRPLTAEPGSVQSLGYTKPSKSIPTSSGNRQRLAQAPEKVTSILAICPKDTSTAREGEGVVEAVSQPLAKAKFVEPGTFWQLGREHRLYCGSPISTRFRERLPKNIALSLAFPPEADWKLDSVSEANSSMVWFTRYQDQDLPLLRQSVENFLLLATGTDDPIVFSYLPDPELLLLAHKLECKCYCADPDPSRCEAVILAWKATGAKAARVTGLRF